MKDISKFIFPSVMMITGILILALGAAKGQNGWFMIGGASILGIGIITLLNALGLITKSANIAVIAVMVLGAITLSGLNYKAIKDPVDFMKEKNRRYSYVIQRLKDIRTAELAYKSARGTYTNRFDSLLNFVKQDSFVVVKAFGMVPDSLLGKEELALELGIIRRDTITFSVQDSIFGKRYLSDDYVGTFYIDSLPYVPFGEGAIFKLETANIERNSINVPVFQVTDTKPFDQKHILKVGSLSDPSTSGNWE